MTALIPFAIIGVCALPWVMLASRRFGHMFGVPAVGVVTVLVLLATTVLGRFTGASILVSTGVVVIALGVLGAILTTQKAAWRKPTRHAIAVWVPAMLGGVAWVVTLAIAQVLPGAAKLAWALNGDANNNLYFAQLIIDQHGIALGGAENPVPMAAALLALGVAPGQPTGDPTALLAHSFAAFGSVWVVLLAATAFGMGAVAASIVQSSRTGLVAVASATGSLLPLTWFVAGPPIEYGYLNVHLVLPIALAAWLIYLNSADRLVPAIAVQLGIATLMLATWSPWVVLPAALVIALAGRHWSTLRTMDARTAAPIIAAVIPAIVWLALASGPALVSVGGAFEIPGHGLPGVIPAVIVVLVLLVGGGVLLRSRTPVLSGVIAVSAATVVGSAALVFLARDSGALTAYYPAKFLWLTAVIIGAIALSFVFALLARGRRALLAFVAVALVVVIAASLGPPLKRPGVVRPPLERILSGQVWGSGDRSVELILANANPADPGILWASGEPDEAFANFWIALKLGGELSTGDSGDPILRGFAFTEYQQYRDTGSLEVPPIAQLCEVVAAIGGTVRVVTQDAGLEQSLQQACPEVDAKVELTRE